MTSKSLKGNPFLKGLHAITQKIISIPTHYILSFFVLLAVVIAGLSWGSSQGMSQYTRYNNYVIFKQSFFHLINYQDLYLHYEGEHYDLYKYSPSFALWMSLFAWMPDLPGLILFNLLNITVLILAIRRLPVDKSRINVLLFFILIETMIALSSSQTNILITGLLVFGYHFMEKDKPWWAALMIVLTFYIKIFGVAAFLLCLLYPTRWKVAVASVFWLVVLGLMPLLVISPAQLVFLYKSWGSLLSDDHSASYGVSLYGWWHTWFGFNMNKQLFVLIGVVLLCTPLLRFRNWSQPIFRLQVLVAALIWVVVFNHKGESPTYIIAMMGIAIWYFTQPQTRTNLVLLLLALVFTSFSSTDLIFPYRLARDYVEPYAVKAVFCSVIWFKLILDLVRYKQQHPSTDNNTRTPLRTNTRVMEMAD
jgi:hypothetical protein